MRVTREITNRSAGGLSFRAENGKTETLRAGETREIAVSSDEPRFKAHHAAGHLGVKWQAPAKKAEEPSTTEPSSAEIAGG